jgi:DNA-binding transcriptional regulator YiaG
MSPADLKDLRNSKGWRQQDLAAALGVTVRRVEDWEQGYRNIPDWVSKFLTCLEEKSNASNL